MENILSRGVRRVFNLPNKDSPEADVAWKLGNAEYRMKDALSSMLSYTDALRVAVALNDYADRLSAEIEQRRKDCVDKAVSE